MDIGESSYLIYAAYGFYTTVIVVFMGVWVFKRSKRGIRYRMSVIHREIRRLSGSMPVEIVCDKYEYRGLLIQLLRILKDIDKARSFISLEEGPGSLLHQELDLMIEELDKVSIRILEATQIDDHLSH